MRLFSSACGGRIGASAVATTLLIATLAACGSSNSSGLDSAARPSTTVPSSSTVRPGSPATHAATLLSRALRDYVSGKVQIAKGEFQQVVSLDPNNKYGWYNLGVIAQYAGDNEGAARDYNKALALDPKFESALYNVGVLRYGAGDWDGAISYLTRATAAKPKDANAWWNLGLALAHKHTKADDKRSTDALNEALKLNPNLLRNRGTTGASGASGAAPTTTTSTG
jgi:tetratricopeptide (TPR) repeat protein